MEGGVSGEFTGWSWGDLGDYWCESRALDTDYTNFLGLRSILVLSVDFKVVASTDLRVETSLLAAYQSTLGDGLESKPGFTRFLKGSAY